MVLLARSAREAIVSALRSESDLSCIYLIGSRSRVDGNDSSDVDLLLVGNRDSWRAETRHQEIGRLRRALPRLAFPVDLLLLTPEEFEAMRHARNHVAYRATTEGVVIHERS